MPEKDTGSQRMVTECLLLKTRQTKWSKLCLSRYIWGIWQYDWCYFVLSIGLALRNITDPAEKK